jgi:secreted trypsin-like serine protease
LNPANYLVTVGSHTLTNADNLAVSRVIMNSAYDENTSLNDIALLKLKVILFYSNSNKKSKY